jgi:hypothetical protein
MMVFLLYYAKSVFSAIFSSTGIPYTFINSPNSTALIPRSLRSRRDSKLTVSVHLMDKISQVRF